MRPQTAIFRAFLIVCLMGCEQTSSEDPSQTAARDQFGDGSAAPGSPPVDAGLIPASPPDIGIIGDRVPRVESGLYSMGVSLAELGGFEVPFQVEIEVLERDGELWLERFVVRATDGERLSAPIADAGPVQISPLGTFTAESGDTVMPAAFSPTGSDVRLNLGGFWWNLCRSAGCGERR